MNEMSNVNGLWWAASFFDVTMPLGYQSGVAFTPCHPHQLSKSDEFLPLITSFGNRMTSHSAGESMLMSFVELHITRKEIWIIQGQQSRSFTNEIAVNILVGWIYERTTGFPSNFHWVERGGDLVNKEEFSGSLNSLWDFWLVGLTRNCERSSWKLSTHTLWFWWEVLLLFVARSLKAFSGFLDWTFADWMIQISSKRMLMNI
jgi:hypothetical protein